MSEHVLAGVVNANTALEVTAAVDGATPELVNLTARHRGFGGNTGTLGGSRNSPHVRIVAAYAEPMPVYAKGCRDGGAGGALRQH